jgi:hypothetical protein
MTWLSAAGAAHFSQLDQAFGTSTSEVDMWFFVIALVSVVASLIFGRVLGRASTEQTTRPNLVHGPVTENSVEVDRLAIAKNALQRRVTVNLN